MLTLNKHAKVSTVTFSPDPQLGVKGQKRSNFKKMSNVKTNGANMLALGKHAKLSTVTFLSDLRLRAQRSKKVEFKKYCYRLVSSILLYAILHTLIHTLCLSKYATLPITLTADARSLQNLSPWNSKSVWIMPTVLTCAVITLCEH